MTVTASEAICAIGQTVELDFISPIPLSSKLRRRLIPLPRKSSAQPTTLGEELKVKIRAIGGVSDVYYDTDNRCRLIVECDAQIAIHIEDILEAMADSLNEECREVAAYLLEVVSA